MGIHKILIANRGEIAVRIARCARNLKIPTVAVYSKEDSASLHTRITDQRICIGEGSAKDSYLNMDRIFEAAKITGADAIHPGYGFLSENSTFASRCRENNIVFIGPDSSSIDMMGNKANARDTMMKAGAPVVPGSDSFNDLNVGIKKAREIGFPVIIKASFGGGGKGMRIAYTEEEFESQFSVAQMESANAFGDASMYLEKFIENPKHIEVQIIADSYGNTVALGERDCSVQRNHQKLIEESPSPAISEETRKRMCKAAVLIAKAASYRGAGTVEFIVDKQGNFYFLEMNTRIQVEHGVTEMITGIDLIAEQIKVANGEKLSFSEKDIRFSGHVIECRINAEIPEAGFMPSPGKVEHLHLPGGFGVRVDTALYSGYTIPREYDSLIAKVIVRAPDREMAIAKMHACLDEMVITGIRTNLDLQYRIMENDSFIKGLADTSFVEQFVSGGVISGSQY